MAYCVGFDIGGTKCAVVLGEYGECGAHGEFGGQGVAVPGAQDSAAGACMQNGAAGRVSIGQSAHGGQDGAGGLAAMAGAQGAAVERSLRIVGKSAFPTAGSPNQTIQAACAAIDGMLAAHGLCAAQISGIGISCGGPLDSASGLILSPPNLPGWDGVPVAGMLRERYAADVRLENDANACAVAEWKFGAARGARDAVFLTFGTGLGAGLILDGRLYRGASGMAGEIGHVRMSGHGPVGYGKSGSLEGFCSGGGIAQLAGQMALERIQRGERPAIAPTVADIAAITAKSVADAANGGDRLAMEAYEISGAYLGRGLAIIVDLLNPEIIVIGSIFARSGRLMLAAMERELARECLSVSLGACMVAPSALGESIGDYAALSLVAPQA